MMSPANIRYYCLSFLLLFTTMLPAMPAWRGEVEKQLADGTTIMVTLQGDRWLHYYMSADGRCWRETGEGYLIPAEKPAAEKEAALRKAKRMPQQTSTATKLNIAPRGLVILVNFSKLKFQAENTQAAMSEMLNSDHYTYNGATGSARQYFIDQSMGQYQPVFDVVGPVNLSHDYDYYGEDDTSVGYEGEDLHAVDMIVEACRLADKNYNVDFTEYDCNNDGEVDFVFVIYAGNGQSSGAATNTIWPHAFWVSDFHGDTAGGQSCYLDGKKINTYACGPELYGATSKTRSGIGTFCHEFSHVLGFPDLYITAGSSSHRTLGDWDILDYGPYLNRGRTPPAYSAYERFFLGWLHPVVLNKGGIYQLHELQKSNTAAIITSSGRHNLIGNDPDPTEFFILENRQQTGWDTYLNGHGLMITKIKYNYQKWYDNTVNNTSYSLGVDIIEAQKNTSSKNLATDLYPAGAKSYTPYTHYPITNIEETDSVISFKFIGGGDSIMLALDDIAEDEHIIAIYNILGHMVSTTHIELLPKGIYIIRTDKSVRKINIQ